MNWNSIAPNQYELKDGFQTLATMHLSTNGAVCHTAQRTLRIRRQGFWKSTLEMTDSNGQFILRVEPVRWYGSQYRFVLNTIPYRLEIQNRPLAHFVITQDGKDVLSYGLKAKGARVVADIHATALLPEAFSLELHALSWFLFQPIAKGETGEDSMSTSDIFLTLT